MSSAASVAGTGNVAMPMQQPVHALHDYLMDIENRTTLHLPMSEEDFLAIDVRLGGNNEVREPAPLYSVN